MRMAALNLFGDPYVMSSRPNVFGELMRVLIAPSDSIREAVNWVLNGVDPHVALHMRMLSNRYKRSTIISTYFLRRNINIICPHIQCKYVNVQNITYSVPWFMVSSNGPNCTYFRFNS